VSSLQLKPAPVQTLFWVVVLLRLLLRLLLLLLSGGIGVAA
jgi:hypothetical protein